MSLPMARPVFRWCVERLAEAPSLRRSHPNRFIEIREGGF